MNLRMPAVLIMLMFVSACAHSPGGKTYGVMKIPAGSNVPSVGLALDASYDPAFDDVVPGYKMVTVAITNNSIDILRMDPVQDKWYVVDVKGSKHPAVVDLRQDAPSVFTNLPQKLRRLIEYPIMIQVGDTETIDLLFKKDVKLSGFKAVKFTSAILGRSFEITARD